MAPLVDKHTTEIAVRKETAVELSPVDSHRFVRVAEKMHDKEYRDGYVAAHTRQVLAKQMREFRGEMSQTEFAAALDKRQTVVSRLENPSYSGWTLNTLFEVASKLNVAVFVRFVDFPTFLKYSGDQSDAALRPESYDQQKVDEFAVSEAWQECAQDRGVIFNIDSHMPIYSYEGTQLDYFNEPQRIDFAGTVWPSALPQYKRGAFDNLKMLINQQPATPQGLPSPSSGAGRMTPIGVQLVPGP